MQRGGDSSSESRTDSVVSSSISIVPPSSHPRILGLSAIESIDQKEEVVHPPHKIRLPFPPLHDTAATLREFWPTQSSLINSIDNAALRDAHRHQELPLARIKKIMKLDDDVKNQMISSEAPVLLAKACELFIMELTLRSWIHTDESKRKTLQKADISQAVARNELFDFLIDIVPRDDAVMKQHKTGSAMQHLVFPESVASDTGGVVLDQPVASSSLRFASMDNAHTASSSGTAPVQYFIQIPQTSSTSAATATSHADATVPGSLLLNGQLVQATQIGQPIQFQSSPGQSLQLLSVGPEGNVQFHVQLPASHLAQENDGE